MKTFIKFLLLAAAVVFLTWLFVNYASAATVKKNDESIPLGLRAAATRVCALWEFKDLRCRNDLLAIAWQESKFDANAKGDWNGKKFCSLGLMQLNRCSIYSYIHPDMFWNPEKAMFVTLQYLVEHGYPREREFAIRAYNCGYEWARKGCGTSYLFWVDTSSRWYEYPQE